MQTDVEFHEAANIFPLDEEHLDELAEDIRANGLQVSLQTLGGKIIDGRRRYLACQKVGVQPRYLEVKIVDPILYVVSLNIHRRHLTPGQRAMIAARARELYDQQAKERQKVRKGNQPGATPANLPDMSKGDSRDQAGKLVGVGGKSVDYASKVLQSAVPEVVQAVDEGRMAVSTAAILASEPEDVQRDEATRPKRNRDYKSTSKPLYNGEPEEPEEEVDANGKPKGVGIRLAHEALNCLIRIPKNDHFRKRGFQIVTDWIKANK